MKKYQLKTPIETEMGYFDVQEYNEIYQGDVCVTYEGYAIADDVWIPKDVFEKLFIPVAEREND